MRLSAHRLICLVGLLAFGALALVPPAPAYIGGPPLSLGLMCNWSTHVMIAQVDRLDRDKKNNNFRQMGDGQSQRPAEVIRPPLHPALAKPPYRLGLSP